MSKVIHFFSFFLFVTTIQAQNLDSEFQETEPPVMHQVQGAIITMYGEGIEGVTIQCKGAKEYHEYSEEGGVYTHLVPKGTYKVVPSKEDNPLNGISTFDQLLIQKHLLGIQPFTDNYQYLAADVNLSGTVTTLDVVLLSRMILGKTALFTEQASWIFLSSDDVLPVNYSVEKVLAANRTVQTPLETESGFDFVGIKRGDVNGSAVVNTALHNATSRNSKVFSLLTEDLWLKPNTTYTIPFSFSEAQLLDGFQLALLTENLSLLTINDEPIEERIHSTKENVAWYAPTSQELRVNTTAATMPSTTQFTLQIQTKQAGYLSQFLSLNQRTFKNEAYTDDLEIKEIDLFYESSTSVTTELTEPLSANQQWTQAGENIKVYPNPSTDYIFVENNTANSITSANTEILLMDVSGKILASVPVDKHQPTTRIAMNQYVSGTYFIKLNREGLASFTQKIIKQ